MLIFGGRLREPARSTGLKTQVFVFIFGNVFGQSTRVERDLIWRLTFLVIEWSLLKRHLDQKGALFGVLFNHHHSLWRPFQGHHQPLAFATETVARRMEVSGQEALDLDVAVGWGPGQLGSSLVQWQPLKSGASNSVDPPMLLGTSLPRSIRWYQTPVYALATPPGSDWPCLIVLYNQLKQGDEPKQCHLCRNDLFSLILTTLLAMRISWADVRNDLLRPEPVEQIIASNVNSHLINRTQSKKTKRCVCLALLDNWQNLSWTAQQVLVPLLILIRMISFLHLYNSYLISCQIDLSFTHTCTSRVKVNCNQSSFLSKLISKNDPSYDQISGMSIIPLSL